MIRTILLAFLVPVFVACGDDGTGDDGTTPCTDETGTVAVTVGAGLQPVLNWEPACAMAFLLIEEGASDQWGISTDDTTWDDPAQANLIVPPLTYGVTPAVAQEFQSPTTLVSGVTYDVNLGRIVAAESAAECVLRAGNLCIMAIHEFTP